MGHRQQMNSKQRLEWDAMQYEARKNSMKGRNYEYWNEEKHGRLIESGYSFHFFKTRGGSIEDYTSIEDDAKDAVEKYKQTGHYARIVCGYEKSVQRTKYFTVIFKKK